MIVLAFIFGFMLLAVPSYIFYRVQEAAREGAKLKPLNGDDRLRLILAMRSFEEAERELAKGAWIDNQPGHPALGELLLDVKELQAKVRVTLRGVV